jgi:hypothetical protein
VVAAEGATCSRPIQNEYSFRRLVARTIFSPRAHAAD